MNKYFSQEYLSSLFSRFLKDDEVASLYSVVKFVSAEDILSSMRG